jgi:hypothetical protein
MTGRFAIVFPSFAFQRARYYALPFPSRSICPPYIRQDEFQLAGREGEHRQSQSTLFTNSLRSLSGMPGSRLTRCRAPGQYSPGTRALRQRRKALERSGRKGFNISSNPREKPNFVTVITFSGHRPR